MTEQFVEGYKVVQNRGNRLCSACLSESFPQEYRVFYEIGKKAFPISGTKLFAFTKIEYARYFLRQMNAYGHKCDLYLAKLFNPSSDDKPVGITEIRDFWVKFANRKIVNVYDYSIRIDGKTFYYNDCVLDSQSAVGCDAIELIRMV